MRIYAIGDIHGRADLLAALLNQLEEDDRARGGAKIQLIFLGDLIDRGPDSASVVELVMLIKQVAPATRLLLGNHEEVFLRVLQGDEKALRFFCRIGGRETFLSYGISEADYNNMAEPDLQSALIEKVPAAHRAFLEAGEDMVISGDYAFVHAGVRPGVALDAQETSDLRWIRGDFLDHAEPFERVVVHGHTISDAAEMRHNRIGIDTGAYVTGKLTALGLQDDQRWLVST